MTEGGWRRVAVGAASLIAGAAIVACRDGGGGDGHPAVTTIKMVDRRFEPARLLVEGGTTVSFANASGLTHNVKGSTFFSRVVEPGDSYRHRFGRPGTFRFVCTFHPGMEGTVVVRRSLE